MTAPASTLAVYIWHGQEQDGTEWPLVCLVEGTEGQLTYRPLMSTEAEHARSLRDVAVQAAETLGIKAVLREYEATSLLDEVGA